MPWSAWTATISNGVALELPPEPVLVRRRPLSLSSIEPLVARMLVHSATWVVRPLMAPPLRRVRAAVPPARIWGARPLVPLRLPPVVRERLPSAVASRSRLRPAPAVLAERVRLLTPRSSASRRPTVRLVKAEAASARRVSWSASKEPPDCWLSRLPACRFTLEPLIVPTVRLRTPAPTTPLTIL